MHRVNPSSNEVITATIECSLYIPPGKKLCSSQCVTIPFYFAKIMILRRESYGLDWYAKYDLLCTIRMKLRTYPRVLVC